ncbi:hypothetical protein PCE1_000277 [Barthelona sp. PCE]
MENTFSIVHFSDLHIFQPACCANYCSKRLCGCLNHHCSSQREHNRDSFNELAAYINKNDRVCFSVCTGDISSLAVRGEWQEASEMFSHHFYPSGFLINDDKELQKNQITMLKKKPLLLSLGNHDVYTSNNELRIASNYLSAFFGHSLVEEEPFPSSSSMNGILFINFCSANAHISPFNSSGCVPQHQLNLAHDFLMTVDAKYIAVCLHHSPVDERLLRPQARLDDSIDFLRWCKEHSVNMILNGHTHIPNYTVVDGMVILDSGSLCLNRKTYGEYTFKMINDEVQLMNVVFSEFKVESNKFEEFARMNLTK